MVQRGHGFADQQVARRGKQAGHFGIKRDRGGRIGVQVGAVGCDERADGAGDTWRVAGGGLGQGALHQGQKLAVHIGADKPVVVDHHLSGPQRCRPVACAVDQFLPHAAVKKGYLRHRVVPVPE